MAFVRFRHVVVRCGHHDVRRCGIWSDLHHPAKDASERLVVLHAKVRFAENIERLKIGGICLICPFQILRRLRIMIEPKLAEASQLLDLKIAGILDRHGSKQA